MLLLITFQNNYPKKSIPLTQVVALSGYITDRLDVDGNKFKAVLQTNYGKIQVNYKISSLSEKEALQNFRYGQYLALEGEATIGEKSRNFNQFDYTTFLKKRRIKAVFQANVLKKDLKQHKNVLLVLKNYRKSLYDRVYSLFPEPTNAYISALVLGDKTNFSDESYNDYQTLGVVHLLAISGLHIQLLLHVFYYVLLRFQLPHEYAKLLIILLIPMYIILTGASASVLRAGLMLLLKFLLPLFMRRIDSFSSLCISGMICLFIYPLQIFDAGFQLSYLLTAGIILSNSKILNRYSSNWQQMFLLSLITSILSIPIVCYHFYQLSWSGIFLNLIYVPLFIFIILPISFISFCIPTISVFGNSFLLIIEKITHFLSNIPYQVIITGRPSFPILCVMTLLIYTAFIFLEKQKKYYLISIFGIICLLFFLKENWTGKVTFIDVGQGDAILIQLPKNKGNYLIDTGGQMDFKEEKWQKRRRPFSVGKNILIPVLKSKGIGKLDKVIATHSDADHIGALEELSNEITIKNFYHGEGAASKNLLKKALKKMNKSNVQCLKAGNSWTPAKNISFECMYPNKVGQGDNNDSLVIKANLAGKTWLFTGDLEKEGEQELIHQNIQADILKVGHHGSKTSTSKEFIQAVNPKIAIISCGVDNRFGHPHKETLETLKQNNTIIYRTDKQGEIIYSFGKGFEFKFD